MKSPRKIRIFAGQVDYRLMAMRVIFQLAVAGSLAGVVLTIGPTSAAVAECLLSLPEVRHEHWSYRLVHGQQCWHPDRGSERDTASAPKKKRPEQATEKKAGRAADTPAPVGKQVTQDKVTQDKVTQDKVSQDKVAQDKLAQDKLAQDKLARDKVSQDKAVQASPQADAPGPAAAPTFTEPPPPSVAAEVTTLVEVETPRGTGNPNADEWFAALDAEAVWPMMRKGTLPARATAPAKPSTLMPKELVARDQRVAVVMLLAGIALVGGGLTLSRRERLPGTKLYLPQ
jgi:hypothetical protein